MASDLQQTYNEVRGIGNSAISLKIVRRVNRLFLIFQFYINPLEIEEPIVTGTHSRLSNTRMY